LTYKYKYDYIQVSGIVMYPDMQCSRRGSRWLDWQWFETYL